MALILSWSIAVARSVGTRELKMNYREIDRALADIFDYSNFKADYGKLMELYLRSMHKRELPRAMN